MFHYEIRIVIREIFSATTNPDPEAHTLNSSTQYEEEFNHSNHYFLTFLQRFCRKVVFDESGHVQTNLAIDLFYYVATSNY
jgi:hypothetical protein